MAVVTMDEKDIHKLIDIVEISKYDRYLFANDRMCYFKKNRTIIFLINQISKLKART